MGNFNTKKSCKRKCDKELSLFTQFICEENVVVPNQKPDIEDVVSVIVDPEIVSLRIVNTPIGCSAEGQNLTGKKLSMEIKMRQKIVYISKTVVQSVHVVENECYKSTFIVVPQLLYGSNIEHLLNQKYISVDIEVENASAIKIDERNFYKNIVLLIKAKVVCNYLLCYTEDYNCKRSELHVCYEDGTKKREIACFDEGKILMIQWSPCGQRIAYICKEKDSSFICVSNIKGNDIYQLTDTEVFRYVSNFSWCADGMNILFTSSLKQNKDVFSINLNTLEWEQLTYGDDCDSIKPKFSADGQYITYIRSRIDSQDLYIMKKNGLGTKRITKSYIIKDFTWENNTSRIVAVCHGSSENRNLNKTDYTLDYKKSGDEIILINEKFDDREYLDISKFNLKIKKIKMSKDNRYISFVGESFDALDIYVYDLLKKELINLTDNECGVNISDYDWNIDSTGIYYSCNDLHYYNVYFVCICDKEKEQISNTKANNIMLCYRPKIV